jgi:hypothetical protein
MARWTTAARVPRTILNVVAMIEPNCLWLLIEELYLVSSTDVQLLTKELHECL